MTHNPIIAGTMLAALAALAFGITPPFIQRFGTGIGPLTTAALLYLGATIGAVPGHTARLTRARHTAHLPIRPRLV